MLLGRVAEFFGENFLSVGAQMPYSIAGVIYASWGVYTYFNFFNFKILYSVAGLCFNYRVSRGLSFAVFYL